MLVALVLNNGTGGGTQHCVPAQRVACNRAHRRAGKLAVMRSRGGRGGRSSR